ncbi:MAG TPA: DUF309 domain-containing protein [Chthoniobacteraceae bacterium]|jgi:hypothetical protein
MKKSERLSAFVAALPTDPALALNPCYQGYFTCFNEQRYYEAHDVLEHLWLQGRDENYAFFKGLIQVAGAFVHLQKQFLRPEHPKDGRRLRPAVRLFHLALANLESYRPIHLQLDLEVVHRLCVEFVEAILSADFQRNPWSPATAPELHLLPAS